MIGGGKWSSRPGTDLKNFPRLRPFLYYRWPPSPPPIARPAGMGGSIQLSLSGFRVPTKALTLDIKGNKTDILLCSYDDHFLVMVTQIGSMGTILHARKEGDALTDQTFNISVIFGKRDEVSLIACARRLIQHISESGSSRPLILSLGLRDHSLDNLKEIASVLIENRIW